MIREQRLGFLFLTGFILLAEVFLHRDFLFSRTIQTQEFPVSLSSELSGIDSRIVKPEIKLNSFNPNEYTAEDWKKIGFSGKQAEVILKYKKRVGGKFETKEQIKACFVISEKKYQELAPFLLLPDTESFSGQLQGFYPPDKKYRLTHFDPNAYTKEDWMNIGFTEKQAEVIIRYKNRLGGKFTSKEQIKSCYVISDKKYSELAPYILLPEKENKEIREQSRQAASFAKKELNTASFQDIVSVTGDARIAGRIINFRKGLGGFVSGDQLKEVYGITPEMQNQISEAFTLDVSQVRKIHLAKASESEIQSHIYLRKYKNKIIEARTRGEDPLQVISRSDPKYSLIMLYLE